MPALPSVCSKQTTRRRRLICLACVTALAIKAGPVVVGNLAIETVAYVMDRTLP